MYNITKHFNSYLCKLLLDKCPYIQCAQNSQLLFVQNIENQILACRKKASYFVNIVHIETSAYFDYYIIERRLRREPEPGSHNTRPDKGSGKKEYI